MCLLEKDLKLLKHAEKLHEILNHREKDEANYESEPVISEDRNQKTVQKFIEERKLRAKAQNLLKTKDINVPTNNNKLTTLQKKKRGRPRKNS